MAGIQGVEEVKEKRSKGCRNPRSGEPGGSMTPKGAGAQKWQKLKGWSFACRARVSHFPSRLCLSERDFALPRASFAILRPSFVFLRASLRFLRAGFPFPARPRVFSARTESVSARVSPFFTQVSPFPGQTLPFSAQAESVSPPPKLRLSEQTSSFSAQAESLPVRFPPHAGFLCFFGAFIAEFYIFYFYE